MRNEMEIAAVTHVAVVDEHDVFVLVHMECECEERPRGRLLVERAAPAHSSSATAARASECASHCTCGGSFRGIRGVRKKCNLVQFKSRNLISGSTGVAGARENSVRLNNVGRRKARGRRRASCVGRPRRDLYSESTNLYSENVGAQRGLLAHLPHQCRALNHANKERGGDGT